MPRPETDLTPFRPPGPALAGSEGCVTAGSHAEGRFHRWLRQKQGDDVGLFCRYPDDVLFSRGFFGKGFHAYFGFTNFAEVDTNIQRSLLYEFVREYVRELSRLFPPTLVEVRLPCALQRRPNLSQKHHHLGNHTH